MECFVYYYGCFVKMKKDKNTILVSSYPKSGATWFQFLIYSCYNGNFSSSKEVLRFYPPGNRVQLIENSKYDPLFIKTHGAYSNKLPFINRKSKCIIIVRHPLDVALSLINHHKNQGSLRLVIPYFKRKFLEQFLKDNTSDIKLSWNHHCQSWLDQTKLPLHIIKYEDLIRDPESTLKNLRNNYSLGFSDEAIALAVDYCSIEKMKSLEQKELDHKIAGLFYSKRRRITKLLLQSSFINKGGSSNHYTTFSDNYILKAAKIFNDNLKRLEMKSIDVFKTGSK